MQLGLGCRPDGAPPNVREMAMKQFAAAGPQIALEKDTKEFHAGFLHEWNNLREVYGENFDKLKVLKKRYDPKNRFNKGVDLVNENVTNGMTV
jgi:FAD/FMN-containing dehydrogenase